MTTAMNVCKILPQGDTASSAGATERASGKPQGRFADAPALVELRKELASDTVKPSATPAGDRPAEKPAVAHTTGQPSAPAKQKKATEGQGVTIGQPQGPLEMLTQTQVSGEKSKADPSAAALPKAVLGEPAAGKVIAGESSVSSTQSHHLPAHKVPEPKPGPNEPQVSVTQELKALAANGTVAGDTVVRGKTQAPVSEPLANAIDEKAAPKPSKGTSNDSAVVGPAALPGAQPTSRGGTTIERTDGLQQPKTEHAGLPTDNIRPPVAIKAVSVEQSPRIEVGSEQAAQEVPSRRQGSTATAAQATERELGAALAEKHPAASPAGGGGPAIRNLSTEAVPAAGKEVRSTDPQPGLQMRAELSVSSHGEPMAVSQRVSTGTHVPIPDGPASRNPVQHIGEQILDSVHASLSRGGRQVQVRLHPPELGTVLVRFQEQGRHVTGILEVGRSDTRHEIEQALPQVLRGLQEAGVQVRRFEVVMSDQTERDFNRGQWQQDAGPQQQNSGQQRGHSPMSAQANWSQGDVGHSFEPEAISSIYPPAGVAQGQLDMLL